MFKNYFIIACRNTLRQKGYSFINIMGLAIGIACSVFILLYIQFELSFDTYHKDTERIFRIAFENNSKLGKRFFAPTAGALAPAIKENYPEVEYAARIYMKNSLVKFGEKIFYENDFMYADQSIFNIFSIPLIIGDASTAIKQPYTTIITEDVAGKYFGNTDPVGNLLNIDGQDYTVMGIAANPPQNTHLKYSIISSMKSIEDDGELTKWNNLFCYSYVKLKEQVKPENFEEKISNILDKYQGENLKKYGVVITHFLQPLTSIHLHSHLQGEIEPPGNPVYLYIFSIVCVFILMIACINFINLTTARAVKRAKEIGMRKVIGANRLQLILQFLGDSCLISLLAALLAFLIVCLSLRYFSALVGIDFSLSYLFKPVMILTFAGLIFFTGIAAGSYPALFLSSLNPAKILKGGFNFGSGKSNVRRTLAVFQFTISIILIIVSVFIYKQIHFMKNKSLGFDKEQKLIIRVRDSEFLSKNFETVKNEFLMHSSISGATALYYPPGFLSTQEGWGTFIERGEDSLRIQILPVDYDYVKEFNIKIAAGRNFKREITTDTTNAILINKTAMKALGFNKPAEAVNKKIRKSVNYHTEIANELNIVGVTDDFHFYGLKSKISPVMMLLHSTYFNSVSLTLNTENLTETISLVENKWNELFPGRPFEYYFLDERIDEQFRTEEQTGKILGTFTFIGIFIACLGLYGLASFIAEQRTKEIGVRKILGSSIMDVVILLTKDFEKSVLFANVFAWPIAYFIVNRWLQNFAYKIEIGISIFIISSISAFLIALFTVGFQTIKAALSNPVDSLRYE